ncbi:hypothetical protein BAU01nite_20420 [Brevibacterium aurantiacum]|nr:hypothetical protein BAU01nite_20420 [Brevibacterium aurantiacum]
MVEDAHPAVFQRDDKVDRAVAREESPFAHDVTVCYRSQDLVLTISGRAADLEMSTVHHQQTRYWLPGGIDCLPLFDACGANELRHVQLLLAR